MSRRSLIIGVVLALALAAAGGAWREWISNNAPPETAGAEHADAAPNGEHAAAPDAHGEHTGGDKHAAEGDAASDSTELSAEAAAAAGIQIEEAASASIQETIRLTGRTTLNQNTTVQVKARFPGIVRHVTKGPGETVASGEVLAKVESNESLQTYPVKSPIGGVVIARNTNVGDVASDAPLFTITDTSNVWAEFHVFPRDIDQIATGQKVLIASFEGDHKGEAVISTLLPVAESSSQTVVARVTLANPEGVWRAGMTVRGDAVTSERQVPVAVRTSAIQRMEGKTVVFVEKGERYETRPIRAGASDGTWTEVIEGLQAGERYVSANSFQIKAHIGKAGAAHEH